MVLGIYYPSIVNGSKGIYTFKRGNGRVTLSEQVYTANCTAKASLVPSSFSVLNARERGSPKQLDLLVRLPPLLVYIEAVISRYIVSLPFRSLFNFDSSS